MKDEPNPEPFAVKDFDELSQALRRLGHVLAEKFRLPQLVSWLNRTLTREPS